ncbi:MAG TPA: GNAT family N-acetyltransferase [Acidimicrobiales bacterium]
MSDDLDAIRAFRCAKSTSSVYSKRAQQSIRDAADLLGYEPQLDCLVAVEDGVVIGVVIFNPRDYRGFGYVISMGVAVAKQNRGIGKDLKRQVMDNCTQAGATKVLSEVHRNNLKMQRVNDRLGIPSTRNPADGKFIYYSAVLIPEDDLEEDLEDDDQPSS